MKKVLIISKQESFAEDLKEQISQNISGYDVFLEDNDDMIFDIIVVDDDYSKVPHFSNHPVVLLTSEHGDYCDCKVIYKPFSLVSFLDEMQAVVQSYENSEDGFLVFNNYEVQPVNKEIVNLRNNAVIKLTEKEIAILKYLFKASGKIVSKTDLLQDVWGYNPDISTHTIETHIYRLRQKVEEGDDSAQLIVTEEGGYRLVI